MNKVHGKPGRLPATLTDIVAATQLSALAVNHVSQIAEAVHQAIWGALGFPGGTEPGRSRGITGLVYGTIRGSAAVVAKSAEVLLSRLPVASSAPLADESAKRADLLAILNGVMGDQLKAISSPFATPMRLRYLDRELSADSMPAAGEVSGKLLLMVHGLCRSDRHWQQVADDEVINYGEMVSRQLGYTPIYLRYNSGLHIWENGRLLAQQLQQLCAQWPVEVSAISIMAHSMGGLVARSACYYAQYAEALAAPMSWLQRLSHIIFLGTPHHGAPLERIGHWLHQALLYTPFTAPFSKLARLRSAGITDLRYGCIVAEAWHGRDRFRQQPEQRTVIPLPEHVACLNIAATTAEKNSLLAERLIGDGLVPLDSALGRHKEPAHGQLFTRCDQYIFYRMNHLALLNSRSVAEQILLWLSAER